MGPLHRHGRQLHGGGGADVAVLTSPRLRGEVATLLRGGGGGVAAIHSLTVSAEAAPHPSPLPAKSGERERAFGCPIRGAAHRSHAPPPLTASAVTGTVAALPVRSPHVVSRLALDSLHHHRCARPGRTQCDAAVADRAARHL